MVEQVPISEEVPDGGGLRRVFTELRQWHVFRVTATYAVISWLVIQVVATVGPAFGAPDWMLRAVVLTAIVGFLATMGTLLFRPRALGKGKIPIYLSRRARLTAAAGGFLAAAAVAVFSVRALSAADEISIAILPFADLSPQRDKAYFAEGVAEEILSTLAAEKGIKVLGRTSARQIDSKRDLSELRDELGVTHVVEGSARTAGGALRVNVRLVETRNGSRLWQEEYRGKVADVFNMQDRIAESVVGHLKTTFFQSAAINESPATKVAAYQAYLAARSIMRNRSKSTLKQALAMATTVIRADPNYAPGQALYAELVWLLSDHPWSYGSIPIATARRISTAHARAAIRLAPDAADGYAALGLALLPKDSVKPLTRAIQLDPSRAEVRIWLALNLYGLGRHDKALQLSREAAAIEPLWPMPVASVVQSLAASSLQRQAVEIARRYFRNGGSKAQFHRMLFLIADRGPDLSTAVREARLAYSLDPGLPDIRSGLMMDLFAVGLPIEAGERQPLAFNRFVGPYYDGDAQELESRIRAASARLWQAPDADIALFYLASTHDWTTLVRLFDQRPRSADTACVSGRSADYALLIALRAVGRRSEADVLLSCVQKGIQVEISQKARDTWRFAGDLEVDRAIFSALTGDREQAFKWLKLGVARGWLGRPFSPNLRDRPAFDYLRGDARFAELQSVIDRRISAERAEILSIR